MKYVLLFTGLFFIIACKKNGCPDPNALNYSKSAETDDGSCLYPGSEYIGDYDMRIVYDRPWYDMTGIHYTHYDYIDSGSYITFNPDHDTLLIYFPSLFLEYPVFGFPVDTGISIPYCYACSDGEIGFGGDQINGSGQMEGDSLIFNMHDYIENWFPQPNYDYDIYASGVRR